MNFVIADDMAPCRGILHRYLRDMGHTVVGQAKNGREAVELCAKHQPDYAILDVSMPTMDGKTAAAAIAKAGTVKTRIIMATSISMNHGFDEFRSLGYGVIGKPYTDAFPEKLQVILNEG